METLEELTSEYLNLSKNYYDLERHNSYLMSYHSTTIEGSTLTPIEAQTFLEKGLTAAGKPLEHHNMLKDHLEALGFVISQSQKKERISIELIQKIAALVKKNTGTVYNTALGSFDTAKGDLRLLNVRAGITRDSFMNHTEILPSLKQLCVDINSNIKNTETTSEINRLAFMAHYQCVIIHPFGDGNGRTSRLLMNYIQNYHTKPMSIVFQEDRTPYIEALVKTRKEKDIEYFINFMENQHIKHLKSEINFMKQNSITNKITEPSTKRKNTRGFHFTF